MTSVDALIHARWVIPVRPRATVLEGHAVAITDGKIVAVLPSAQADAAYAPAQRIDLPTHALTPGWVNAHTHAAMTLLRGVGDDLPLMQWLNQRIWPLETALVDEQFVHDGSQLAALEMLRAGTTTCSDMYFYPDVAARALRSLGMRAVVGIIAIEMPTGYATDAADYLRKGLAARDALRDDPLAHFTLAPHAPYTVADDTLAHIATLAEELDLPVHIHVHETQHEIDESVAQHGQRPLARLDRLGLVSERLIAVHAVHLTDGEIALLAERGATVVHCPASNLKLASGIAPVARLLQAGARVAFGTDGAASNNRLDLIEETRLAALLAKGASGDAAALPAWQALECATLNGAAALGLEARIGSIEPGKDADLAAFDFAAAETTPCFDPVSHLVYAASRERVSDVWVAGRHVVRGRQPTVEGGPAVAGAALERAAAWQNRARRCLEAGL
ncbi:MAG: TRZ/ATZ family hydrolase [Betaproteobacteria bacterium]